MNYQVLFSIPEFFYTAELFKQVASKKERYIFKGLVCCLNGKYIAFFRRTSLKWNSLAPHSRQTSYQTFLKLIKQEITKETEWVKYDDNKVEFVKKNWLGVI